MELQIYIQLYIPGIKRIIYYYTNFILQHLNGFKYRSKYDFIYIIPNNKEF